MPNNIDLLIYALHLVFWIAFGVSRFASARALSRSAQPVATGQATEKEETAQFSRTAVVIHSLAFAAMYFGLAAVVIPQHVPQNFGGQRVIGAAVIAVGAGLASWAVASFRSWRLRAKLDAGHQLVTDGPFRFLRHPIYMSLNLLALGSAIWVPTGIMWCSLILMLVGSDLRARIEERLLNRAFGATYKEYCARTRRFVPGIY